ncbi:unnamed protein product, partial [Rhizophagus irregularis]
MEEVVETAKNSDFTHDTVVEECEGFISAWANQQGFRVIKDRVLSRWRSHSGAVHISVLMDAPTNPIQLRNCYKKNWLPEMWESWPLSKELQGIRSITITFGGTICW